MQDRYGVYESQALYRQYPDLFWFAGKVIERACSASMRQQAVWWTGARWEHGPANGIRFMNMPDSCAVAGIYTHKVLPVHIVQDMLAVLGDLGNSPAAA